MSSWLDRMLEELQRRQLEEDARREGRPYTNGGSNGDDTPPPRRPRGPTPPFTAPGRGRRWIWITALVIVGLFVFGVVGGVVQLLTDLMWYDALGRRDVLTTRLWATVGWFAFGFIAFVGPALLSVWAARRLAPQAPIRRVGSIELPDASGFITPALVAAIVIGGLLSGAAWGNNWAQILLFFNGGSFGQADASFGRDIGFYIFDLPFWQFVQGWAVTSLIVIIILTVLAYAAGALRRNFYLSAPVRAHLSILGAVLLVVFAVGYQLDTAALVYSTRGVGGAIQAATYTDMHAQVPAYAILTGVALVAAALLLANIWFRTLWLIGIAAATWLALALLVGGLYPAIIQRFSVEPNEAAVEKPYLAANIAATREAFDLNAIDVRSFTGEQALTRSLFDQNKDTISNVRLWDYRPLLTTFDQQQTLRQYYLFNDVDIDRYTIGGAERQIMLSGREIAVDRLADTAQTWTNQRLVFTHGYGLTAVPVNAITPEGQPDYLVSGINRNPDLPVSEPRLYFGESTSSYVVVRTATPEFDFPLGAEGGATTSWTGTTGVSLSNFFSRLLFAVRFGDLNLLITDQRTDDSQILFRRALNQRVPELAPFLSYDRDPYLVSANGRLVWIWDAYTLTSRYPNAQPLPAGTPFAGANYLRNSVKVVVDAYTGDTHFYVMDPTEPIIAAYARIFPTLFEPASAMAPELVAHLRYPEDLFTAQNETYLLYHVTPDETGAGILYNQDDRWAFPNQQTDVSGDSRVVEPYYVIMRIPGESASEFVLIQPLVAASRPNMIAWVAARMDPGAYGQRIAFRFPSDTTTLGPEQIQARINQDSRISAQFTLWSQAGSEVVRGDLLVLPMGDSILYVEPIYLRSTQSAFPEFKRVILASQTRIAFADSMDVALRQILGEADIPNPDGGGGGGGELPSDAASLVALAQTLYAEAQQALVDGDLGLYQDKINQLASVLDALSALTGGPQPSPGS
jgi:uncharacterized membrane protein (UPF0182 family)